MSQIVDVKEALEVCEEILEIVPELPERAEEFADSIQTKTLNIKAFVEKEKHVTINQFSALLNMLEGAKKWIR